MSSYNQNQPPVSYPPPSTGAGPHVVQPPPPVGYPMKDGDYYGSAQNHPPIETKSRGDGFWKGCCAALCCCCVLDACF